MITRERLTKFLLYSAVAHAIFLAFVFIQNKDMFNFSSSQSEINFIKTAVKVDVVAMPKFTLKELRSIEMSQGEDVAETKKEAPQKEAPVKQDNQVELKKANNRKSFLNRLKKIGKRKTQTKPAKSKPKNEKKPGNNSFGQSEDVRKLILAGNKISQGSALTGETTAEDLTELELYMGQVSELVRQFWKLPSYLRDRDLQCKIQLFLGTDGNLIKMVVIKPSGVDEFDRRAKRAINEALPLPSPPSKFTSQIAKGSIGLVFPL
jgi:outer membrane biosynthesis protein TonB